MQGGMALTLMLIALLGAPPAMAQSVTWPTFGPLRGLLHVDGYTDVLPDFIGPLDGSARLTIFTEGNQFPVLLPLVLQRLPRWCQASGACEVSEDQILIVTLPQPMIVRMLKDGGIILGNAVLPVGPDRPVFPDLVMGGAAPLRQLHQAGVVADSALVFARSRGMSMLLPKQSAIADIGGFASRVDRLILASSGEPGAREQYRTTLVATIGETRTAKLFARELETFPGRLGIQHRDVPYALLNGLADGGLIVRHLARFYAHAFGARLKALDVPGADRFAQDIAVAQTARARDKPLAAAFERFLLEEAPAAYSEGGFAVLDTGEFGRRLDL